MSTRGRLVAGNNWGFSLGIIFSLKRQYPALKELVSQISTQALGLLGWLLGPCEMPPPSRLRGRARGIVNYLEIIAGGSEMVTRSMPQLSLVDLE